MLASIVLTRWCVLLPIEEGESAQSTQEICYYLSLNGFLLLELVQFTLFRVISTLRRENVEERGKENSQTLRNANSIMLIALALSLFLLSTILRFVDSTFTSTVSAHRTMNMLVFVRFDAIK